MNPFAGWCILGLTIVVGAGCRTSDPDSDFARIVNEPAPLSVAARAKFGVVGVLPAGDVRGFDWRPPKNYSATFGYTADRTFRQLERVTRSDDESLDAEVPRYAFISALTLAAGTVNSIFNSVPEAEMNKGRVALTRALESEPLATGIQTQVLAFGTSRRLPNLVPIPEPALARLGAAGATNGNYRVLAGSGFDSVLLMRAEEQGFVAPEIPNPMMAFSAKVNVEVVRVADGAVLHAGYLIYQGRKWRFTQWVANDAKFFREEMELARATFAATILEQLFGAASESVAPPVPP